MEFLKSILFLIKNFWFWSILGGGVMFLILFLCNVPTLNLWVYSAFSAVGVFLILSVILGNKRKINETKKDD